MDFHDFPTGFGKSGTCATPKSYVQALLQARSATRLRPPTGNELSEPLTLADWLQPFKLNARPNSEVSKWKPLLLDTLGIATQK